LADNLNTILKTINRRDHKDLSQTDINKMLLEIVDKAMVEDHGAKGLEVALRAVSKLAEGLTDTSLNATDEDIKGKLPAEVLRIVEGKRK
jgi:hypothetical protein|tara:strand:- start:2711 stop:2980 length:270 start_codon:yes stop_codon:yes gene_type:complete